MTVPATPRRAGPFSGTGAITALPFEFKVFEQADVRVTRTGTDGLDSILVLGDDYTVTLNPDQEADPGGSVTPLVAPAIGEFTTLTSVLAYEQPLDLLGGGNFRPQVIEDAFDRTVIQIQQLAEVQDRSLTLPATVDPALVSAELPVPQANRLIGWNESETGLQNFDATTLATIVAFGTAASDIFSGDGVTTAFVLSNNPGAINNLDVSISGVTQKPGDDYTWSSGTTLTFVTAPPAGTRNILVRYAQALPTPDFAIRTDLAASSGASLVGYLPAGTGAVARTVQSKLRDSVHVSDFMTAAQIADVAAGTATLNVSTAVANAIQSLSATLGGEVVFGPGVYLLSPAVFTARNNLSLKGAGAQATTFLLASAGGAGTMLTFSNCQWFAAEGITFQLQGTPQGVANTYGLRLDNGSNNAEIKRCNFLSFAQDGLQLVGTAITTLSGIKVQNCYFLGNGGNQFYSYYSNDFHYQNNQFGSLAGVTHALIGCLLDHSSAGNYTENYHWDNRQGCKADTCNYNTYALNRIEYSDREGFYATSGSYNIFSDNKIHTNSQTTTATWDGAYFVGLDNLTIEGNIAFSFNAIRHRYDINVDTGCTNVTMGKNKLVNFAPAFGPVRIVGSAYAQVSADEVQCFASSGTVAAGSTVYFGTNGQQAVEANTYTQAGRKGIVSLLFAGTNAAPGVGQTFTYTLRVNGVDTAMVATSSGGASFSAAITTVAPGVLVGPDDSLSVKLVTSAGATVTNHRVRIAIIEY